MKYVNPRRALGLSTQVSKLVEKKFQANDVDFFLRLEKYIEQENLSDQRFCVVERYAIEIPKDYSIIDNTESYQAFIKRWNSEKSEEYGELGETANFTNANFLGTKEQLISGMQYTVTEYGVRSSWVSEDDCLKFLEKENAGLYGLSGLLTILDLDPRLITSHDHKVISIDHSMLPDRDGIYTAQKSVQLKIIHHWNKCNSISRGSIIVTFQLR